MKTYITDSVKNTTQGTLAAILENGHCFLQMEMEVQESDT
jgi:hypothetical protein